MQNFTCPHYGYTAKSSVFESGVCPACCRDLETGEWDPRSIPLVYYEDALKPQKPR